MESIRNHSSPIKLITLQQVSVFVSNIEMTELRGFFDAGIQPSGRAVQHSNVFMSVYLWQVLYVSTCQDSLCYFWLP